MPKERLQTLTFWMNPWGVALQAKNVNKNRIAVNDQGREEDSTVINSPISLFKFDG
jgi:hypothetical protein